MRGEIWSTNREKRDSEAMAFMLARARDRARVFDDLEQERGRACSGVHKEVEESEGDANDKEIMVGGASGALTGRVARLLDHGHGQRGRESRGWRLGEGGGEGASPGTVAKLGI